jgi:hypothetical protein
MLRFDLYVLDTQPVYRYAINIATRKYRPLTPWLKARGLRGSFGQHESNLIISAWLGMSSSMRQ